MITAGMPRRSVLLAVVAPLLMAAGETPSEASARGFALSGVQAVEEKTGSMEPIPDRITIVPDDYHVPWAGTAADGRKFFLSDELFDRDKSFVGLFLWKSDGSFDTVQMDEVARPEGLPPGQAGPADAAGLVEKRLAQLGEFTMEPIHVEPFLHTIDGIEFGWRSDHYDDGTAFINIEPGNFICYYAPWDGLEYDT